MRQNVRYPGPVWLNTLHIHFQFFGLPIKVLDFLLRSGLQHTLRNTRHFLNGNFTRIIFTCIIEFQNAKVVKQADADTLFNLWLSMQLLPNLHVEKLLQSLAKRLFRIVNCAACDVGIFAVDRRQHDIEIGEHNVFGAITALKYATRGLDCFVLIVIIILEHLVPGYVNWLVSLDRSNDLPLPHLAYRRTYRNTAPFINAIYWSRALIRLS